MIFFMSRGSHKIFYLCFSTVNYINNTFLLVIFLLIEQIYQYYLADTVPEAIATEFVKSGPLLLNLNC